MLHDIGGVFHEIGLLQGKIGWVRPQRESAISVVGSGAVDAMPDHHREGGKRLSVLGCQRTAEIFYERSPRYRRSLACQIRQSRIVGSGPVGFRSDASGKAGRIAYLLETGRLISAGKVPCVAAHRVVRLSRRFCEA